jgi:hypothetical protein
MAPNIRRHRAVLFLLSLLFGFIVPSAVQAETRMLTAEATYVMGDGESPSFAEAMVLQKAKQLALEQAGTYVESYTRIKNYELTAEEVQTLAGGVLEVEVLDKQRTLVAGGKVLEGEAGEMLDKQRTLVVDGLRFYIKIKATVTTDKMEELAQRIKGKNVAQEYKKLQEDYARLAREIESWKQLIAKTPPGPEREQALEQMREHEKVFGRLQKDEAALFRRFISGESLGERLVAQGLNDKQVIDDLFAKILSEGHVLTIGPTQILPDPEKPDLSHVTVPVTLTASLGILPAIKESIRMLSGTFAENELLYLPLDKTVLIGDRKHDPRGGGPIKASLVRVAKDTDLARYFQQRISNLGLLVEIRTSGGNDSQVMQCKLRYYPPVYPPMFYADKAKLAEVQDSIAEEANRLINVQRRVKELRSKRTTGKKDEFIKSLKADVATARNRLRRLEELLIDILQKARKQVFADLYVPDGAERRRQMLRREDLHDLAEAQGLFMRNAPVAYRLSEGGVLAVGETSEKLSRRLDDIGYVVIFHDPATLKIEWALPQDTAKAIQSITARVIEITADQWESLEEEDRCRVVP